MYSGSCIEGLSGFASEVGDQGPEGGMDMAWGRPGHVTQWSWVVFQWACVRLTLAASHPPRRSLTPFVTEG